MIVHISFTFELGGQIGVQLELNGEKIIHRKYENLVALCFFLKFCLLLKLTLLPFTAVLAEFSIRDLHYSPFPSITALPLYPAAAGAGFV